ncbi:MAG TPA: cytochrome d ubiquinol oxidase subunit II [Streptosporangiaceae bacterium]|jgi:cytochrome d ubiquinol oxidase subunit II
MTLANVLAVIMWVGVTAYALFGGADFGAGFWDLVAGRAEAGAARRTLIEHSIGPVWEANHVWLIFILVVMWTGFPGLFGAVASTLWIPLTVAALGVIGRGSAFAFRKSVTARWQRRAFGAAFAASSVITPFFLGAAAGGVAAGRVPPGVGQGNAVTSWWNPVSVLTGALAVIVCAYLAAVYLTADARRTGDARLVGQFRACALGAGAVAGLIAAVGLAVLHAEAPTLAHGLANRALPLVVVSGVAGLAALIVLFLRRFLIARTAAAVAVGAVVWAWALAEYPYLLAGRLTIAAAAATHSVLLATSISLLAGAVLLIPSLTWLYVIFQREPRRNVAAPERTPAGG